MDNDLKIVDKIRVESKIGKYIYLMDGIIIFGTGALAWITRGFVYEPLAMYYVIYSIGLAFFATRQPRSNPDKRNYQVMLLALKMDSSTYHMIDLLEIEEARRMMKEEWNHGV